FTGTRQRRLFQRDDEALPREIKSGFMAPERHWSLKAGIFPQWDKRSLFRLGSQWTSGTEAKLANNT
ncbi:MAG TPA: hypothetical protein VN826_11820, partial [Candidatus Eisenbacteria bacterium]|nr:hypothetical protein [Candidatus Eisenbacteria bacterium]